MKNTDEHRRTRTDTDWGHGAASRLRRLALLCGFLILACRTPLPAPGPVTLLGPAADSTLRNGLVAFAWDSIAGAANYELQVDDKATFISPVFDTAGVEGRSLTQFLADGSYHWRVRAKSRDSVPGDWSSVAAFSVATYRIAGQIQTRGYPQALCVQGDYAYVAEGQAGLGVYRVLNPGDPEPVGALMDTINSAYGVAVRDSFAYLAYGRTALQVVAIARPESMRFRGDIFYTTGYSYDVKLLDSLRVAVATRGQFTIIDVTSPDFPQVIYEPHAPCRAMALRDTFAFLACEQLGLMVMTTALSGEPVTRSIIRTPGNARDVAVAGDYAYVADGRTGLTIVDISTPGSPQIVATIDPPGGGYGNKVAVADGRAYLANGTGGLAIVDVADPAAPKLLAVVKLNEAKTVWAGSGRVLVGDRDMGLVRLEKIIED